MECLNSRTDELAKKSNESTQKQRAAPSMSFRQAATKRCGSDLG